MQGFIDQVTRKLGVGESESKSAVSGIMEFIRERLGEASYAELVERIPGASEFLRENQPVRQHAAGGGLMGSLTSMAGGLLGGQESGIAGVAAAVAAAGISVEKVGSFLTLLIGFIREELGDEHFRELTSSLPDLFGNGE